MTDQPVKTNQVFMRNLSCIFIVAFCLVLTPTHAATLHKTVKHSKHTKHSRNSRHSESRYKAGKVFQDCTTCPRMVVIPAGEFNMGSPDTENERDDDEGPVHRVKIATFALSRTEITRGQFAEFVKESKYDAGDKCWMLADGKFSELDGNWLNPGFRQPSTHPVTCINWDDAQAYAKWLTRKTHKRYRLPTEAEWEYAARAKTRRSRYWGSNPNLACRYANVADRTAKKRIPATIAWRIHNCTDRYAYTAPAGHYRSNAFGLKDMLGNVWEWTEDVYHDNYNGAPADGRAWKGEGNFRVLRGGSWNSDPQNVRAAVRNSNKATQRFSFFGFRIARKIP